MGWFTKKEENPEKKDVSTRPTYSEDLPRLPELPKSGMNEIKNSLEKRPLLPPSIIRSDPTRPRSIETQEFSKIEKPSICLPFSESPPPLPMLPPSQKTTINRKEPFFVKLDKFKEASTNFEKIKDKVQDIEDMLQEIKEIKEKENQELEEWEQELQLIKQRIESIDNSIFQNIGD